jgi:hypothetical protein
MVAALALSELERDVTVEVVDPNVVVAADRAAGDASECEILEQNHLIYLLPSTASFFRPSSNRLPTVFQPFFQPSSNLLPTYFRPTSDLLSTCFRLASD